jgi:multidrug efflux pump subunit AcrA (membrane-fusion protein)
LPQPVAKTRQVEQTDGEKTDAEPRVDLGRPVVWVVADDGRVQPVEVKTGLSDGMVTEIISGDLEPGDQVVAHEIRQSQPDFVSSFISHLTESKNQ